MSGNLEAARPPQAQTTHINDGGDLWHDEIGRFCLISAGDGAIQLTQHPGSGNDPLSQHASVCSPQTGRSLPWLTVLMRLAAIPTNTILHEAIGAPGRR